MHSGPVMLRGVKNELRPLAVCGPRIKINASAIYQCPTVFSVSLTGEVAEVATYRSRDSSEAVHASFRCRKALAYSFEIFRSVQSHCSRSLQNWAVRNAYVR